MEEVSNVIWTAVITGALLIWSILTLVNCYDTGNKKQKKKTATPSKATAKKGNSVKKTSTTKKKPTKSNP